jgi:hypothetical protein
MAGMIRSIEKSNDLIGNRTRELPACSIVNIKPNMVSNTEKIHFSRIPPKYHFSRK